MSQNEYDILLVEDSIPIRETLRLGLESEGYSVHEAGDGEDALSILEKLPRPGLIFLDLLMPGMNGMEFLDHLQSHPARLDSIPVIILSAVAKTAKAEYPQVRAVLSKPVSFDDLFELVRRNLARKRER